MKKIYQKKDISPEKRQYIIHELRLANTIMEYQKITNLLDNTSNQPFNSRTKQLVEINDQSKGVYNTNSDIILKTSMLKSSLHDWSDACILVKGRITITGAVDDTVARQAD